MKDYSDLCCKEFESWNGIVIPKSEMQQILADKLNGLQAQLESWGYEEDFDGLDTCERDTLHDAIAQHLGVSSWPLNMNRGEPWVEEFYNKIRAKILSDEWSMINDNKV